MPLNYYSTQTEQKVGNQTYTTSYCSGSAMYFYSMPTLSYWY